MANYNEINAGDDISIKNHRIAACRHTVFNKILGGRR